MQKFCLQNIVQGTFRIILNRIIAKLYSEWATQGKLLCEYLYCDGKPYHLLGVDKDAVSLYTHCVYYRTGAAAALFAIVCKCVGLQTLIG
jgi:hypothetical protein